MGPPVSCSQHLTVSSNSLLHCLGQAVDNHRPLAIALIAPSGAGKTYTIHTTLTNLNISCVSLSPSTLSSNLPGVIESHLSYHFHSCNPRRVLLLDHIDLFLSTATTPTSRRLLASLIYHLSHPTSQSPIFLCTAPTSHSIPPPLHTFLHFITLPLPTFSDRLNRCLSVSPLPHSPHHIASVTPGYSHANLTSLFSLLLSQPEKPLSSLLDLSRPSHLLPPPPPPPTLYGLHSQIRQLKQLLHVSFQILSPPSPILHSLGVFRGAVLHGPTGCGKTALTALAASLLPPNSVNVITLEATNVVTSEIGAAERTLRSVFEQARQIAPTLLIVENLDVLGGRRDLAHGQVAEAFGRILSTMLTEIDGVEEASQGVFVLATTRDLDLIDDALIRPGRLEVYIEVDTPDDDARACILKNFFTQKGYQVDTLGLDIDHFISQSKGWTAPDVFAYGRQKIAENAQQQLQSLHVDSVTLTI